MSKFTGDDTDFSGFQGVAICILVFALGIGTAIAYGVQKSHHHDILQRVTHDQNFNNFWLSTAKQKELSSDAGWARLSKDLRPLVENPLISNAPNTPLVPKDITGVRVDDGLYPHVHKDLNYYVFQGEPPDDTEVLRATNQSCIDCGKFTEDFLQKIALVRDGKVTTVLRPILPPKDYAGFTLTIGGMPGWLYASGVAFLIWLIGWLIGLAGNQGLPKFSRNTTHVKFWLVFFNFFYYIPKLVLGSPFWIVSGFSKRHKAKIERENEEARLRANPVYQELITAQNRLATLRSMPPQAQMSKVVKQAIRDTNDLVSELQKFPDQLSVRASELIAKHMLEDNQDSRTRPKALIEAADEVDNIS